MRLTEATATRQLARQRISPQRSFVPIIADIFVCVVGLFGTFIVHFIGDIAVSEIILLAALPVLILVRGKQLFRPGLRTIFILLGCWLLGQVASDIYRRTPAIDWMRGNAGILFFSMEFLCLALLLSRNERRKALFVASFAVGELLSARLFFAPAAVDPWKFGYAAGTIDLVVFVSCFFFARRKHLVALLLLFGIIAVNLLFNYRSPVLQLLITAILLFPIIPERVGRLTLLPRAGSAGRVVVLLGLSIAAAALAREMVAYVTASGLISEDAQRKNTEQEQGGNLLLAGRPEILVSSSAVIESPIIGHGSWAKDMKFIEMLVDLEAERGMKGDEDLGQIEEESAGLIPTHSHLLGAWVWAGILGAMFWAYLLWLDFRAIVRVTTLRPPLAPWYVWRLVAFFWAILFSPTTNSSRIIEGVLIVIILDLVQSDFSAQRAAVSSRRALHFRQFTRMRIVLPGARRV